MCTAPDAPKPADKLPEAPQAPDEDLQIAGDERRKRLRRTSNTILTSPRGVTQSAQTSNKTLLGV